MMKRTHSWPYRLLVLALFAGACAAPAPVSTTVAPTSTPKLELGPTPIPTRTRHAPGELFEYAAQSGDTLPALAAHFNTTVDEIRAANPDLPETITTLPPGYSMLIPAYYVPLMGPAFHILPDSEVVFGPSTIGFDISKEIRQRPGFLAELTDYAYRQQRPAWGVVEVIARNYSVNPRLLLAFMEYQSQALSQPFAQEGQDVYPLGFRETRYAGLFWQLIWVAERVNDGYYAWRAGTLPEFELADGLLVRPDPWLNAGTAAVQFVFAGLYGSDEFKHAVSPDGFYATYSQLWGDPFALGVELIPANLQQPELMLPFLPDRIWDFTAGPHFSWGKALPFGALDFAPPSEETGCVPSPEWIAAPGAGVVARSEEAIVILDLDGDGDERTGWVLFFFHVATDERVEQGVQLQIGDTIGHPSCEGGRATGTHFHMARRYNGEWVPAAGVIPMQLDGWVTAYGEEPYLGTLTKGSVVVPASDVSTAENRILYEFPGP